MTDEGASVKRPRRWNMSRSEAAAILRGWYREHGRLPTQQEWDATGLQPCSRHIRRRWGWWELWATAAQLSLDDLQRKRPLQAQPDFERRDLDLLSPLITHHDRFGRWPRSGEWERATQDHASRRTYSGRFGSWQDAISAAERERRRRRRQARA